MWRIAVDQGLCLGTGCRPGADICCPDLAAMNQPIGLAHRHPLEAPGGGHLHAEDSAKKLG